MQKSTVTENTSSPLTPGQQPEKPVYRLLTALWVASAEDASKKRSVRVDGANWQQEQA